MMLTGMIRWITAILIAALAAGAASGMQNPLRDRLLRNERAQESTGWYQRADTGAFFLFDRSGEAALLRERDAQDSEVLVLYSDRAPGGGTAGGGGGRLRNRADPTLRSADAPGQGM